MHVQVKDDLTSPPLDIDEKTIAAFRDRLPLGHLFGSRKHSRQDGQILGGEVIDAADMLFRYNQKMNRRMGVDIFEYHKDIVFIQDFGGGVAVDNSTEDAAFFHPLYYNLPKRLGHPVLLAEKRTLPYNQCKPKLSSGLQDIPKNHINLGSN
jgi:hypothetical protein